MEKYTTYHLVEGQVKALKLENKNPQNETDTVIFSITHVYWGPKTLLGKTFESGATTATNNGEVMGDIPKVGEKGIWTLLEEEDGKLYGMYPIGDSLFIWFPFRIGIDKENSPVERESEKGIKRLAQSLEEIYNIPPEKRLSLLIRDAASDVPEEGAWAIQLLADYPAGSRQTLEKLAERTGLPGHSKAALDRALCYIEPADWINSNPRYDFWSSWISVKDPDGSQIRWLLRELDNAGQSNHMDGFHISNILQILLEKRDLSPQSRQLVVDSIAGLFYFARPEEAAFYRAKAWAHSKDHDVRVAAAKALAEYLRRMKLRLADIHDLLDKTEDKEAADILRHAFDSSVDPHRIR